tara:strand:+ start:1316 stop:3229 length:1914 start_codon:yes stop_codon:yes gene_type:complete
MTDVYTKGFNAGLLPDEDLTVDEWADKYRMLSAKASSLPGKWKTDTTPYLREPMRVLTDPRIQRIVLMCGAQLGKSELIANHLGWQIDISGGPCMIIQPTVELAKRFSKQRITPLLEETPRLREKVPAARSRDSSRTMFSVEYPNGLFILCGANSGSNLRSMPCRFVLADELDAYPLAVGAGSGDSEGDPLSLAEKRTSTFGSKRKIVMTSTPTVKDFSRIEKEFLLSDQRRYYLPCPKCGAMQYLKWSQMRWDGDDPKTARYECEACGETFTDSHKTKMLRAGEWRATAPGDGKTAGFQLSTLYAPAGWITWEDLVDEFIKSREDQTLLRVFVNTRLGETYADDYASKVNAEGLLKRCEPYTPGKLPNGALVVTMGVDVQGGGGTTGDRLVVSTWAWGKQNPADKGPEEGWLIDHQELMGDPQRPEVWRQLDALITKEWEHQNGTSQRADVVAIDSGGWATHETYQFARERAGLGVIAVKGSSQKGKPPIGKPSRVDIAFKNKRLKRAGLVHIVGTDTLKDTIFGRLKNNEEGPGTLHFHGQTGEKYFEELTAEKQAIRFVRGFVVREYVKKPGARNEALDCLVYSRAGLELMLSKYDKKTFWEQMAHRLEKLGKKSTEMKVKSRKAQKPGFVTNW